MQRLSHGLARHIVGHWPEVSAPQGDADADADADAASRAALMSMLMAVNPGIEVYLLDADGRVASYIGEPGMVRREQVDLHAVRRFLGGAPLPLRGTDPKTTQGETIFSAAMFPPRPGDSRPPGYLYVVLQGQARQQVAAPLGLQRTWQTATAVAALALALTLLAGAIVVRQLTRPLRQVAQRIRDFDLSGAETTARRLSDAGGHDELRTIAGAFEAMAQRIGQQLAEQARREREHREVMAGVAHDLRTPLTALHGNLEALTRPDAQQARHVQAALAQSNKVRRLTQQLFELATLQTTEQMPHRERFRLDELVADVVQKHELHAAVQLGGPPPGRVECEGDLQLIDRALTNLIDNSLRHGGSPEPVRVQLQCVGDQAQVLIEDRGPGLPAEVARRLDGGTDVRDPPLQRPGGGIGGLGLAIVQRIAKLHGGALRTQPSPRGGTRLLLWLPVAADDTRAASTEHSA